jgi:hypothetical protein
MWRVAQALDLPVVTEKAGAPSLRFLQGWAAMLRARFEFVVAARSNPQWRRHFGLPPLQRTQERCTHCVGAGEVKILGHPPSADTIRKSRG